MRAIGGVLQAFAAPGVLGLRADFLPQHLGRGLALVADCLAHPAFPEHELDAAERVVLAHRREDVRVADAAAGAALAGGATGVALADGDPGASGAAPGNAPASTAATAVGSTLPTTATTNRDSG